MAAWTLDRLIDRAEDHLREAAVGLGALPSCACVVDGGGRMGTLAFPVPDDDNGRDALAAVLAVHLDRVGARMWVLALPTHRRVGGRSRECALLDGQALGAGGAVRRSRLLRVERRRGAIAGLHPLDATPDTARPAETGHPGRRGPALIAAAAASRRGAPGTGRRRPHSLQAPSPRPRAGPRRAGRRTQWGFSE